MDDTHTDDMVFENAQGMFNRKITPCRNDHLLRDFERSYAPCFDAKTWLFFITFSYLLETALKKRKL